MRQDILSGDCLELMKDIPSASIDMVLADLPYGVTRNKWDCPISLPDLWQQYERVIKPNGAILLFGQDKFSAKLMLSNERLHRYNLVWEKSSPTGYLNAKRMPLRSHEDILVFYKSLPVYNPQMTHGHTRKVSTADHKRNSKVTENYGSHRLTSYDSTSRYPKSVLMFPTDKQKEALTPTQKPVALLACLIKTYTHPGEVVLDNVAGSGSTAIACMRTGRAFIVMEKDDEYFQVMKCRIEHEANTPQKYFY